MLGREFDKAVGAMTRIANETQRSEMLTALVHEFSTLVPVSRTAARFGELVHSMLVLTTSADRVDPLIALMQAVKHLPKEKRAERLHTLADAVSSLEGKTYQTRAEAVFAEVAGFAHPLSQPVAARGCTLPPIFRSVPPPALPSKSCASPHSPTGINPSSYGRALA